MATSAAEATAAPQFIKKKSSVWKYFALEADLQGLIIINSGKKKQYANGAIKRF